MGLYRLIRVRPPSALLVCLLWACLSCSLAQHLESLDGFRRLFGSVKEANGDGGDALDRDLRACRLGHSLDPSRCGQMEYVSSVYKDWQRIQAASAGRHEEGEGVLSEIPTVSPNVTFQEFFVDYAIAKRPVKVPSGGSSLLSTATAGSVKKCLGKAAPSGAVLENACPELLQALRVPRFVANDYTQRLRAVDDASVSSFVQRYPALHRGSDDGSPLASAVHACPTSGQLLLSLHQGSVDIKAFPPDQAPFLGPEPGDEPWLHHFHYTADVWTDSGAATGSGNNRTARSPPSLLSTINQSVASLSQPGDLLYLPHDWLVSWRFTSPSSSLLAWCYTDAANLNAVKSSLALEAHISTGSRTVRDALSDSEFDTAMVREARDLDWRDFAAWPRSDVPAAAATEAVTEGTEKEAEEGSAAAATAATARSGRQRRERKNFKTWQAANRWNFMVLALTLPAPSTPIVRSVGRHNATVEWTTPFTRRKDDKAFEIRYMVSWHAHRSLLHHAKGGARDGNVTVREEDLHKEVALDDPRVSSGLHVNLYRTTIHGLDADSIYHVRVRVEFGEAEGPWSIQSRAFTTHAYALPWVPSRVAIQEGSTTATTTTLVVHPPADDGGLPVQRYLIWKKNHPEAGFREGWALAGNVTPEALPNVVVRNLLPDVTYVFKVAAVNGIGIGPQTHDSPPVHTEGRKGPQADEALHLGGHGHDAAVEENLHGVLGPVVTIDDTAQTVTLLESDKEVVEVWAAHWSPRHYKLTAEVVYTAPRNASTIDNADAVAHRIALAQRGDVPLVYKAAAVQAAGGMGLIILDNGLCSHGFDQMCCPGADKAHNEGLAASDEAEPWRRIRIPVVLMRKEDAGTLLEAMHEALDAAEQPTRNERFPHKDEAHFPPMHDEHDEL